MVFADVQLPSQNGITSDRHPARHAAAAQDAEEPAQKRRDVEAAQKQRAPSQKASSSQVRLQSRLNIADPSHLVFLNYVDVDNGHAQILSIPR